MDPAYDNSPEAELPSCAGCRKRKLKCSRQKPACSNCERLDTSCIYEARRTKPGLKSGAVESLNQRLEKVERALFGQIPEDNGHNLGAVDPDSSASRLNNSSPLEAVLATLAGELQRLNQNIEPPQPSHLYSRDRNIPPRKRPRFEVPQELDDCSDDEVSERPSRQAASSDHPDIVHDLFDELVEAYFDHIQPWIPMINMKGFKERVQQDTGQRITIVLQAMAVAALRHVQRNGQPLESDFVKSETSRLRRCVMIEAMDDLSVENLQALIIIAFTDIGDGNLTKAWPIIGSLTRTVEYMELSVEAEDRQHRPAVLPDDSPLPPPLEWTEEEERRRVFWNIFILDRFSSVVKGWNTSLTAADVCRRLPICGGNWFHDEPAITPYFGIWDRSRAKIGISITFLPGHYPSPSQSVGGEATDSEAPKPSSSHAGQHTSSTVDMSKVGAFAYYVESIESLSQITTYFLQTKIDFTDRQEVSLWLTRFKELDLRLVHWKMYLPQQWKDSGISREIMPGVMDPNMTAANATHNTSLILLHQRIAYPDAELKGIRLPSLCSADTCYNAAMETANITTKYLEGSSSTLPVSPQLGICAFVSGRVLLVMSYRWAGHSKGPQDCQDSCFFGQLSNRLESLYQDHQNEIHGDLDVTASLDGQASGFSAMLGASTTHQNLQYPVVVGMLPQANELTSSAQNSVEMGNNQWQIDSQSSPTNSRDELSAISQLLMNNDFLEMDRIISFEDMMPAGEMAQYFKPNE
ncbi:hypothetical protein FSARC_11611 [Fusarium sarcochroum]|uniref:Zn(2)-C6 fungal-type domain-containing protein n=1 Tax=Fusarium sarcochroum TaxID=1208366 RepID=A0A8H4TEI8_9HYPO|nr:hypothetical protein FSARC_11611 [Fusarium sarcochroum]